MNIADFPLELLGLVGGVQAVLAILVGFLLKLWGKQIIEREHARLAAQLQDRTAELQARLQETLQEKKAILDAQYQAALQEQKASLEARYQAILQEKRAMLEATLQEALHISRAQLDTERAIYVELWTHLLAVRRATNAFTLRKDPPGKSATTDALKETLKEARRTLGRYVQEKRPFFSAKVAASVTSLLELAGAEASRKPDGSGLNPNIPTLDMAGFSNLMKMPHYIDRICEDIRERLTSTRIPIVPAQPTATLNPAIKWTTAGLLPTADAAVKN